MRRIVEKLLNNQPNLFGDILLAAPWIVCGLLLAINFGSSKFGMPWSDNELALFTIPDWFVQDVATFGGLFAIVPFFFIWMSIGSKTLCGIVLTLELLSRSASFLIVATMLTAVFFQKWDNGLWTMLPVMSFLCVSLYTLVMGSGKLRLDFILAKMLKKGRFLHVPIGQMKIKTSLSSGLSVMLLLLAFSLPAQDQQVTFSVDMRNENAGTVGVKGSVSPLSWDKEISMTDENGDGVFEVALTFDTSMKYIKFKFSNDGKQELEGADKRIAWFAKGSQNIARTFNEYEYYDADQLAKLTFTKEEIEEDVATLSRVIQYIHPAIYKYRDSVALQSDLVQLQAEMMAEADLVNAYKAISKFTAQIKCSHTFTNPWNQGGDIAKAIFYQKDKLPLTFKRLGDRLFVDKNASENDQVQNGLEIISINGVAVSTILTTLSKYVTADGNNYEKKLERLTLTGAEKYSLFDIFYPIEFVSADQFELELKDYKTKKTTMEVVSATSKTNRTKILLERYDDLDTSLRSGWNFELLNDRVGKLTIKSFAVQRNEFDWKAIIDEAFEELNTKNIPNLILDIRENEGGQGEVGEYILERIIQESFTAPAMQSSVRYLTIPKEYQKHINTWDQFPYDFTKKVDQQQGDCYLLKQKYSSGGKTYKPKKNGYKGKVFLITDGSNSSATHLMAAFAKQIDGITLVGQETGGNQFGTNGGFIFFLRLPNTRIDVDIPVINMFVPPFSGEAKDGGIQPDIEVTRTVQNMIDGIDAEMEVILSMIEKL